MATQTIQMTLIEAGLSVKVQVYAGVNGAVVTFADKTATEYAPGVYRITVDDSAGVYRLHLEDAADGDRQFGTMFVQTTNTAATFEAVGEYWALTVALEATAQDILTDTAAIPSFPVNFAALGINASGHVSRVTLVDTTTTNTDMRGTDGANTATPLDAAATRAAIGLATANADTQLAAIQSKANDIEADTQDIQGRIPAALVVGRMDATVGAYQSGLTPLQPTTAGRTVDVTLGGCVGIDWSNIESPTSTVDMTGTTISTSQAVATVSGAVTLPSIPAGWITGTGLDSTAIVAMGSYQIPQTVPAVGVAPTRDQAIMMLAARGRNSAIVDTTETIYAADGTTPLYTLTLTNDGQYTNAIARAS